MEGALRVSVHYTFNRLELVHNRMNQNIDKNESKGCCRDDARAQVHHGSRSRTILRPERGAPKAQELSICTGPRFTIGATLAVRGCGSIISLSLFSPPV